MTPVRERRLPRQRQLPGEPFQRGSIAHGPAMTEWIGKASLAMRPPWNIVVRHRLHIGRAGLSNSLYEFPGASTQTRSAGLGCYRISYIPRTVGRWKLGPSRPPQHCLPPPPRLACTPCANHRASRASSDPPRCATRPPPPVTDPRCGGRLRETVLAPRGAMPPRHQRFGVRRGSGRAARLGRRRLDGIAHLMAAMGSFPS
jgi:hypothetical protein